MPDNRPPEARVPVILICSGFQGLKELIPAKLWQPLTQAGYACASFDYRGFGTSDGERGRMLPLEQVEDIRNAITFLQQQSDIASDKIGLIGWGFGGGLAVYAAAIDSRVLAIACLSGVGDGGRAVRDSRPYADWLRMQGRIAEDRVRRVLTGKSQLVSPWEVVPLDPATRENVDEDMYGNYPRFGIDVTLQSAEAYYAFQPERVAHQISPRPLLIVHGVRNALHPIDEARSLYAHAQEPKTLIEIPDGNHLNWIQPSDPLYQATIPEIIDWFRYTLPPTY
jgi:pimeloyl-ACP methyl ester carboxylesterase